MPKKGNFKPGATADSVRQRKFNSTEKQKTRRAERNSSRAKMVSAGKASKGDGLDTDHKNHKTSDMSMKNLSMMSVKSNRSKNQYDKRKKK